VPEVTEPRPQEPGSSDARNAPWAPFAELGAQLERDWLAVSEDLAAFPELAAAALTRAELHRSVDLTALLRGATRPVGFPQQADIVAHFGQPPLTLFASRRFHISALFWVDGTTSIHEHNFSGAFQVLLGGSLQTRYRFTPERALGVFQTGRLTALALEHLRAGDVRRIEPGPDLIHSLFHLDRPSISLVIRTWRDPRREAQFSHYRPGIAVDPFFTDDWATRVQQIVRLLATIRHADAEALIGEMLAEADPRAAFLALKEALALEDRALFDRLVERAVRRLGPLAETFPECFEELRRVTVIGRRRGQVRQPDHRTFLALMMNAPDRRRALEGIAAHTPGAPPEDTASRWIAELARVNLPLQVAGVAWEPNVLGLPEGSDAAHAALRAHLRGEPPPARGPEATFLETLSRSPYLRPLFR
jgi:hypothetical protein